MNKKNLVLFTFLMVFALIAAACGGSKATPAAPADTAAPAAAKTEAAAQPKVSGQLNILGWEGYDDPEAFKPFYDQTGVVPNSTYIGNNDEVISKYKAGGAGTYDIGNINSRYLKPMIQQGMLQPLDESRLPNLKQLFPAWFDTNFGRGEDGKLYAVPAFLGFSYICYRTDSVPEPPDWNYWQQAPWSEKYSVTTNPLASMYIWAMTLGKGQDASKWTKQDLEEIKAYGMEKWKGAVTTASSIGEQTDLLVRGDATTTDDCFEFIANNAKKQGVDVKAFMPAGPKKIWVDAYFILNGAKNIDAAYAWINYAIGPEAMAIMAKNLGTAVSNQEAYKLMAPDLVQLVGGSDLNETIKGAQYNVLPDPDAQDPYVTLDDLYKAFDEIKAASGK